MAGDLLKLFLLGLKAYGGYKQQGRVNQREYDEEQRRKAEFEAWKSNQQTIELGRQRTEAARQELPRWGEQFQPGMAGLARPTPISPGPLFADGPLQGQYDTNIPPPMPGKMPTEEEFALALATKTPEFRALAQEAYSPYYKAQLPAATEQEIALAQQLVTELEKYDPANAQRLRALITPRMSPTVLSTILDQTNDLLVKRIGKAEANKAMAGAASAVAGFVSKEMMPIPPPTLAAPPPGMAMPATPHIGALTPPSTGLQPPAVEKPSITYEEYLQFRNTLPADQIPEADKVIAEYLKVQDKREAAEALAKSKKDELITIYPWTNDPVTFEPVRSTTPELVLSKNYDDVMRTTLQAANKKYDEKKPSTQAKIKKTEAEIAQLSARTGLTEAQIEYTEARTDLTRAEKDDIYFMQSIKTAQRILAERKFTFDSALSKNKLNLDYKKFNESVKQARRVYGLNLAKADWEQYTDLRALAQNDVAAQGGFIDAANDEINRLNKAYFDAETGKFIPGALTLEEVKKKVETLKNTIGTIMPSYETGVQGLIAPPSQKVPSLNPSAPNWMPSTPPPMMDPISGQARVFAGEGPPPPPPAKQIFAGPLAKNYNVPMAGKGGSDGRGAWFAIGGTDPQGLWTYIQSTGIGGGALLKDMRESFAYLKSKHPDWRVEQVYQHLMKLAAQEYGVPNSELYRFIQ